MGLRRFSIAIAATCACALSGCAPAFVPGLAGPATYHAPGNGAGKVRLAVQESGKGKPIVLIHGLGTSSYTWNKIMPELARTNRVIAIDLKGFGKSDKPLDGNYSIFDQARLIEDTIRENNLSGVTLIGHSYGGAVALAVALAQMENGGDRVERLVLLDSVAYRQPMPFFFQVLRTPVIGEIGMALIPPEVQAEHALTIAYYNGRKVPGEAVQHYAQPLHTEGGRHALFHTINSLEPDNAEAIAARYRNLKLPALVLWCDHDRIVPIKFGERLAGDLPNAQLRSSGAAGTFRMRSSPAKPCRRSSALWNCACPRKRRQRPEPPPGKPAALNYCRFSHSYASTPTRKASP